MDVLLGNGDGTFGPPLFSSTTYDANGLISAGDFNGDGKLDLVVTTENGTSLLLGNGDGTFQSPLYPIGKGGAVCVGDFNGDGKLDLAGGGSGGLLIYLGNGDGTFQSPTSTMIQPPGRRIVTADFNGDGKLDIATTSTGTTNFVTVLLGNGDGTFQTPSYYGTGTEPVWLDYGDFNGDGKLDLVTANQGSNTVSVFLGIGDGTFQTKIDFGVGKTPNSVAAGDFNGDGRLDLAVGNFQSTTFSVLSQTVTFSPQGLNFGNQPLGSTSRAQVTTFTNVLNATLTISSIRITGANSSDFSQTNNCGASLPPGGSCNISVTFTPSAVGNSTAAVSVSDSAPGSPQIAPLAGIGTQPAVMLSPPNLEFGNQTVGITSPPQVSTLTNAGNGTLTITSIGVTGSNSSDFAEKDNCGTSVAPSGSCNITVTFRPSSTGKRTAAVSIRDNAPGSPQSVPLSGIGVLPAVTFSPVSLTFPDQVVFTSSPTQSATLTNIGLGTLLISKIAVSGPFSQTNNCPSSLNPGANCTISVKFHPTTKGVFHGTVSVTDNAPGSPQKVPLTGTGTFVQLVPTTLNFGTQPVGTRSLAKKITLTNKGSAAVDITSISITGIDAKDFAETNTCGKSVASGASCFMKVTFKPLVKGKRTANVSVYDNGGGSPQQVGLTGTGT